MWLLIGLGGAAAWYFYNEKKKSDALKAVVTNYTALPVVYKDPTNKFVV